ncbi:thioredoxin-disulfide reductase [Candidatus Babeliales bacterium]|nr:thioredoxin-disulfide reductase [Candidatus Babeliales bacterium]
MTYDIVVIGSGPAGLTAGIYGSRAGFKTLILEGNLPGGQLMTTTLVENWPGDLSVQGPDLMDRMRSHAKKYGAELVQDPVVATNFSQQPFTLTTESGKTINTHTVIIATGAEHKKLGCLGEKDYFNKGVSTCATCDGPFFRDKEVVIIGGGNTAVTEAEHLSHLASKVTVVHILDQLTANDPIKNKILNHPKVNFVYNTTVVEMKGDGNKLTEVVLENQKTKERSTLPTDGAFVAIGFNPSTKIFAGQLKTDAYGYLVLENQTKTSVPGVFAAGDVADYRYRQAVTAAGMGCMAALDAQTYLGSLDHK